MERSQNGEVVVTALIISVDHFNGILDRSIPLVAALRFGRTLVGRTLPIFPKQPVAWKRFRPQKKGSEDRPLLPLLDGVQCLRRPILGGSGI
jgi:hypothetical protein